MPATASAGLQRGAYGAGAAASCLLLQRHHRHPFSSPRSPLPPSTSQPSLHADWERHVTWRRYLPEPRFLLIVALTLFPIWGWSVLVSTALGLYVTFAEARASGLPYLEGHARECVRPGCRHRVLLTSRACFACSLGEPRILAIILSGLCHLPSPRLPCPSSCCSKPTHHTLAGGRLGRCGDSCIPR